MADSSSKPSEFRPMLLRSACGNRFCCSTDHGHRNEIRSHHHHVRTSSGEIEAEFDVEDSHIIRESNVVNELGYEFYTHKNGKDECSGDCCSLISHHSRNTNNFLSTTWSSFGDSLLNSAFKVPVSVFREFTTNLVSKDSFGSSSNFSDINRKEQLKDDNTVKSRRNVHTMARTSTTCRFRQRPILSVRNFSDDDAENEPLASPVLGTSSHRESSLYHLSSLSVSSNCSRNNYTSAAIYDGSYTETDTCHSASEYGAKRNASVSGTNIGSNHTDNEKKAFTRSISHSTSLFEKGVVLYRWLIQRYLYFAICKSMHLDISTLSRISVFGKKKVILLLLLLPLLLWCIFSGALMQGVGSLYLPSPIYLIKTLCYYVMAVVTHLAHVMSVVKSFLMNDGEKNINLDTKQSSSGYSTFLPSWLPFQFDFASNVAPDNFISSHQKTVPKLSPEHPEVVPSSLTEIDVKMLAKEVAKEEVADFVQRFIKEQNHVLTATNEKVEQISKLQEELKIMHSEFASLADGLKSVISVVEKSEMSKNNVHQASIQQEAKLHQIKSSLNDLGQKILTFESLMYNLKNCCQNASNYFTELERHLSSVLIDISKGSKEHLSSDILSFRDWLFSTFIDSETFSKKIHQLNNEVKLAASLEEKYEKVAKHAASVIVNQHINSIRHSSAYKTEPLQSDKDNLVSRSEVQKIVKEALLLYDADKTGETDYALESGGGSVVNTRCSETYTERNPQITVLGFPLWSISNSPRNAIQPGAHPGQCWAFKGSQGFLVVQLAAKIKPTAFIIEHIPKSLSPTGNINSAPKDFSVWGLISEKDSEGKLLGKYTYDISGEPLQHFFVQDGNTDLFSFIELKIHSNHGDPYFTCLYRFRVHGSLS